MLRDAGFAAEPPEGAYYVLADFSRVKAPSDAKADDVAFTKWLVEHVGVAGVPGSSFFHDPALGRNLIRFHFAKSRDTLLAAQSKFQDRT
jgi:aminotransferase